MNNGDNIFKLKKFQQSKGKYNQRKNTNNQMGNTIQRKIYQQSKGKYNQKENIPTIKRERFGKP
jgi:hypothetical protein